MASEHEHHCHAEGCEKAVPPKLLACKRHWYMVTPKTRKLVWATYRAGQEKDKRPSAAYLIIQALAIGEIAMKEGRWTEPEVGAHVAERIIAVHERMTERDKMILRRTVFPNIDGILARIEGGESDDD